MAAGEFTFTDEQQQLRTAVRKFCAENFDEQTARRLMESDPRFDPKVWPRLGSELGVLGLSVPEADGGVGGTLVDQAVAVEEFGATLACGPLFGTVYLAIPALVAASAGPARDELLAALVEGRRTAAFAVRIGPGPEASVERVGGPADDGKLTGTVDRVVDADAADELLVAADRLGRAGALRGRRHRPGVQRTPSLTLDLTRPQATVPAVRCAGPAAGRTRRGRPGDHPRAAGGFGTAGRRAGRRRTASAGPVGRLRQVTAAVRQADRLVPGGQAPAGRPARRPRACPLDGVPRGVGADATASDDPALAAEHRAGDVLGGVQPGSPPTPSRCTAVSGSRGSTRRTCTSSGPPPMPRCSAAPSSTGRGSPNWCSTTRRPSGFRGWPPGLRDRRRSQVAASVAARAGVDVRAHGYEVIAREAISEMAEVLVESFFDRNKLRG